jgi:hypothetical protein
MKKAFGGKPVPSPFDVSDDKLDDYDFSKTQLDMIYQEHVDLHTQET